MENKRNGIVGTLDPRPVGIICALEVELKDLLAELRDREDVVFNGYEFHCGRFGEIPAVLVQCGVGKVNAARGTQMLIDAFGPCCVINSGIAGGTKPGLAIGDIVIGEDLAQHDFDVTAFGYALGYMCTEREQHEPTRFTAEPVLVEELEQAAQGGAGTRRAPWPNRQRRPVHFRSREEETAPGGVQCGVRRDGKCGHRQTPIRRSAFGILRVGISIWPTNGTGILRSVRARQRRSVCGSDFGIPENPPEAPGRIM